MAIMKALLLILLCGLDFPIISPFPPDYYAVRAQAVKESKPLLVWIGYSCKSSERQLPDCLHHHATAEEAALFPGVKAGVVVAGMEAGVLVWKETILPSDVCASGLRRALSQAGQSTFVSGRT